MDLARGGRGDRRPAAGGQRHRLSGDAGGGHIPPGRHYHASQDEVSAVFEMPLACAPGLGRYHPLDIHRRGNDHRVWLSAPALFCLGNDRRSFRELALQIMHVLLY